MQHFDGDKAHGPVQVFLSDSGRIAFVCAVDQATWEMAIPLVKAKVTPAQSTAATGATRSLGSGMVVGGAPADDPEAFGATKSSGRRSVRPSRKRSGRPTPVESVRQLWRPAD